MPNQVHTEPHWEDYDSGKKDTNFDMGQKIPNQVHTECHGDDQNSDDTNSDGGEVITNQVYTEPHGGDQGLDAKDTKSHEGHQMPNQVHTEPPWEDTEDTNSEGQEMPNHVHTESHGGDQGSDAKDTNSHEGQQMQNQVYTEPPGKETNDTNSDGGQEIPNHVHTESHWEDQESGMKDTNSEGREIPNHVHTESHGEDQDSEKKDTVTDESQDQDPDMKNTYSDEEQEMPKQIHRESHGECQGSGMEDTNSEGQEIPNHVHTESHGEDQDTNTEDTDTDDTEWEDKDTNTEDTDTDDTESHVEDQVSDTKDTDSDEGQEMPKQVSTKSHGEDQVSDTKDTDSDEGQEMPKQVSTKSHVEDQVSDSKDTDSDEGQEMPKQVSTKSHVEDQVSDSKDTGSDEGQEMPKQVSTKSHVEDQVSDSKDTDSDEGQEMPKQVSTKSHVEDQVSDTKDTDSDEGQEMPKQVSTKSHVEDQVSDTKDTDSDEGQEMPKQVSTKSHGEDQVSDTKDTDSDEGQEMPKQVSTKSHVEDQVSDTKDTDSDEGQEMPKQVSTKSHGDDQDSDMDTNSDQVQKLPNQVLDADGKVTNSQVRLKKSHQDSSKPGGKQALKRIRNTILLSSEDSDDNMRKRLKLTAECVVVTDSDKDSRQSDLFPFLKKEVIKISNQAESDTDGSDEECSRILARDINDRNIYVSCAEKSLFTKSGKRKKTDRKYNARHVCPFCKVKRSNFSHHIQAKMHEKEEVMKKIKAIKGDTERKRQITQLRLKSDHENNINVIKEKKGEIFLLRRFNSENSESSDSDSDNDCDGTIFDVSKYGPCPNCFGWVLKKSLRRHVTACSSVTSRVIWTNRALEIQSDMISGKLPSEASQSLIDEVYPIMRSDNISKIAQQDDLIVILGNQWMMRNRGNEIMRKYYTSTVMRLTAKLKVACQTMSKTNLDMTSYLAPKHFETVLKAALSCCHILDDDEELKAPSNAIKLGFDIKRMLSAKLSKSIMKEDEKLQKEATDFQRLMEIEWGLRVSKLARGILVERSYNKKNELPRPSDVKRLFEYLQSKLKQIDLADKSSTNFRQAAVLTLARLTLYNRRRCHEVQAMRLSSYAARTTGVDEIGLEVRQELTEFKQVLLNRQEVVVLRGKTGRGVPVIMPPDVIETMKFLTDADVRLQAGIQEDNKYVFASKGVGVFRAYDAIREVTQSPEADLQMPDLIRTSNMRKYMATMLQALNTTEAERQWVLDHLGHTMNVHRIHYRQTSDVLERVDVAKVLLIQDLGLVAKYRGKKIQDIQIEDLFREEEVPQTSSEMPAAGASSQTPASSTDTQELLTFMEARRMEESEDEVPEIHQEESADEEELVLKPKRKKPQNCTRQKWVDEEVTELHNLFAEAFRTNTLPKQKPIEKAIKRSKDNGGVIWMRKRDTIKKKLSNMIIKRRRDMILSRKENE